MCVALLSGKEGTKGDKGSGRCQQLWVADGEKMALQEEKKNETRVRRLFGKGTKVYLNLTDFGTRGP